MGSFSFFFFSVHSCQMNFPTETLLLHCVVLCCCTSHPAGALAVGSRNLSRSGKKMRAPVRWESKGHCQREDWRPRRTNSPRWCPACCHRLSGSRRSCRASGRWGTQAPLLGSQGPCQRGLNNERSHVKQCLIYTQENWSEHRLWGNKAMLSN